MNADDEVRRLQAKIASGDLPADEPLFVLRAQDVFAPLVIDYWVEIVKFAGTPDAKTTEATAIARRMEAWRPRRVPGKPQEDADAISS